MYAAKRAIRLRRVRYGTPGREGRSPLAERAAVEGRMRMVPAEVELAAGKGPVERCALGPSGKRRYRQLFIPFAEQTGFIKTITRWVIQEAVRQAAAWRSSGRTLKVAINISAQDLLNPELPGIVSAALQAHDVPPELLSLEITESGIMQDAARAIEVMQRLADIGVGRAIDDFGTGYSSLAYIKQLPLRDLRRKWSANSTPRDNEDDASRAR